MGELEQVRSDLCRSFNRPLEVFAVPGVPL
jgi:hypothetical protein